MANNIVQLTDYNDNNIYPIAGAAAQGSITKSMLEEGVFEGPELSEPSTVAYVATDNIQNDAVNSAKIDSTTIDLSNYTTSKVTSLGARQVITIKGGVGVITTGGTVMSAFGDIFDNIPVSVPYVQELSVVTSSGQSARVLIMDGTNPGTSKISINAGAITYPAGLYINGAFPVN